ncbi:carnitine 3-dehydrogenase [Citreicella sp. C3M06]|uniref:carnitine 3-dehydrogenase n=1 Tax=Roseobacteraceae TaxID=2854170 RepID=UPI001C08D0D0|nr:MULTISPECIES: carnitine 3-dehydrogenase [Roseobacteraceae]MBU2962992.1 carnitine 3-dehydrogenase [Citreicella sp. C3M06]MDO6588430.1 carnitine 3-dehydrogenase [Salipiger sp. 1_MG-2023]
MSAPVSRRLKAAIVGGGVIGGGWAARFLLNGWDVAVFDPDPDATRKINEVIANARIALPALYDKALPSEGTLTFHSDLADALADVDWVQESVPEQLELKHKVLGALSEAAPADAVIASSTSGFKPSELNAQGARAIVAHPFNPVYLLPLVELVGAAERTAPAAEILRSIGMFPLVLRKEIDAHIADRLLEAVWRESLWLVKDGVATTEEIDEAIRMGFGIRWAQMGLFETYRIAGGEAGMKHFMKQFGPALSWPWTKLMDVPEFTPELVDLIAGQSDAQSGHLSIRELERLRDDNIVGMVRALKRSGSGAAGVICAHEAALAAPKRREGLPVTACRQVPSSWTDYNGHMNETHYLEAASKATDRFMELIGADAAYVAGGKSYFTVESHVRYLEEVHAGDRITITSQVLNGAGKKLHLLHRIWRGDGTLAATIETLLLHTDLEARRACEPEAHVADALSKLAADHAALPAEGAGRFVGQRPTA